MIPNDPLGNSNRFPLCLREGALRSNGVPTGVPTGVPLAGAKGGTADVPQYLTGFPE